MTMLDRMRRHQAWLKWSLGIVVVTFVAVYVPQFLGPSGTGVATGDSLATVNGREIKVSTYQRIYAQQVDAMRASYGADINEQMLRQLGIPTRILQQLIADQEVLAEADRLGITVSDGELKERILRLPGFQENGQFVGTERYQQILDMQRPPLRKADFEQQLRDSLRAEKLQAAVTGWVSVSDAEVEKAYRERSEKVKLELAVFTANQFRNGIQPTEDELAAQFNGHQETYRMPEKRRVRYVSVDADSLKARMTATPAEVEQKYKDNAAAYSTPEQVRASHILFKTDGKDEAAVKKLAETVLAKVKAGGDFAALAKQYSEDGSKDQGGDLNFFGRGAMVKEFEDAAFGMQPGQVSDLVKSQFGFHIIKLTERRAATTKTINDVRAQLEDSVKVEKAQAEAAKLSGEIAKEIKTPEDLDKVARSRGLAVSDSGLFARDEPLAGLGFAPAVTSEAFTLEQGKVSGALQTTQGFAFIAVAEIKPSYLPKLDEVRDKVREDVVRTKAVEVARQKAATMAAAGKTNFAAAAKAAGVEVKTTELVTRGAALPEVGVSDKVDQAVFALKAGEVSAPIATDNAVVVARVKEREDFSAEAFGAEKESLRASLLQQRRGQFFAAYMAKMKDNFKTVYNERIIQQVLGGQ